MRFLILFSVFTAILHTALTLCKIASTLLDFQELRDSYKTCTSVAENFKEDCKMPREPVSSDVTYQDSLCQSDYIHSLQNSEMICQLQCIKNRDQFTYRMYDPFWDTLSGSATPSSTLLHISESSPSTASTTSALDMEPIVNSAIETRGYNSEKKTSQIWIHKNGKYVVTGIVVLVVVLALTLATLLCYRRRSRPLSSEEAQNIMLQERLEEIYGHRAIGLIVPLKTLDPNRMLRGRLSWIPFRGPMITRRQRAHNRSISDCYPLNRPLLTDMQESWSPQRPASARTTTSSIGQRSASSPLAPISCHMLQEVSHAESLKYYVREQAENLKILRSTSSENLGRMDDH